MQGIGNDYLYVDCFRESLTGIDLPELARRVSDRRFGIGGDGLILIMPGEQGADFRMRMFNADGSEGDMCGNGMRCLARYVFDHGHTDRREFSVITPAGLIENRVLLKPDGTVAAIRVMVGTPGMLRGQVPMTGDPAASSRDVRLTAGDREFRGIALSVGNPHFVIEVDDAVNFPVAKLSSAPNTASAATFTPAITSPTTRTPSPACRSIRSTARPVRPPPKCSTDSMSSSSTSRTTAAARTPTSAPWQPAASHPTTA
jgi:diaminopimelate epimerase